MTDFGILKIVFSCWWLLAPQKPRWKVTYNDDKIITHLEVDLYGSPIFVYDCASVDAELGAFKKQLKELCDITQCKLEPRRLALSAQESIKWKAFVKFEKWMQLNRM